jgi:hypothetical protein
MTAPVLSSPSQLIHLDPQGASTHDGRDHGEPDRRAHALALDGIKKQLSVKPQREGSGTSAYSGSRVVRILLRQQAPLIERIARSLASDAVCEQ